MRLILLTVGNFWRRHRAPHKILCSVWHKWCGCRRFLVISKQYSIVFAFIFHLHITFFMLLLLPKLLHLQKCQALANYNNILSEAFPFDWLMIKSSLLLPYWWFQIDVTYYLPWVLPYILFFQLLCHHPHSCDEAENKFKESLQLACRIMQYWSKRCVRKKI